VHLLVLPYYDRLCTLSQAVLLDCYLLWYHSLSKFGLNEGVEMAPLGKPKRRIRVEPLPQPRRSPETPKREPLPEPARPKREKVPAS